LASFRTCAQGHVFDGFSCVPKHYCLETDSKEDSLDKSVYDSAAIIRKSDRCSTVPSYSFIVTGDSCDPEFGVCVDNKTTIHKCGRKQVFVFEDKAPKTIVDCKTLSGCIYNRTNDDDHDLRNSDFPVADDFCDLNPVGFYAEKECGRKYALCYCTHADSSICQPKLVRLSCPNRRYVFDKDTKQCVLRRKANTCENKFDVKEFCYDKKRPLNELIPCSSKYIDCDDYEHKTCSGDTVFLEKFGKCGYYDECHRRPLVYSEDVYYPGPDMDPEFDDFAYSRDGDYRKPPY
jgi:hypothetical protein